jgi:hypothetical protein
VASKTENALHSGPVAHREDIGTVEYAVICIIGGCSDTKSRVAKLTISAKAGVARVGSVVVELPWDVPIQATSCYEDVLPKSFNTAEVVEGVLNYPLCVTVLPTDDRAAAGDYAFSREDDGGGASDIARCVMK